MEIGGYFYFKHPKASSITPILRVGIQEAMEGTKTVEQALKDIQAELTELLTSD